uniref:Multiple inositol polyphosphate phosphatase 1 n=1 Tax=Spongospora subterranea TaxID=70186 RepID=A0A0H5QYV3_9EUKA|eukprot:CRZ00749.1 hypothetical protein [Spongospora subterranea]
MPTGICCLLVAFTVAVLGMSFEIEKHLSTNTPYYRSSNPLSNPNHAGSCELHQVNMVIRHGSRFPTKKTIELASQLHRHIHSNPSLSNVSVPDWLLSWAPEFAHDDAGELTTLGMEEQYNLAQRLQQRFPEVFKKPYHPNHCKLRSTQKSRAGRSASAFALGLWHGTGQVTNFKFQPAFIYTTGELDNDIVLRPFDACPVYSKQRKATSTRKQYREYVAKISPEIASGINQRIFNSLEIIPANIVMVAWKVCKAEMSAIRGSVICDFFSKTDVERLELADDIESYWEKGPGHQINIKIICPLLEDLIESLKKAASHQEMHLHLDLRFAHAETLIPLISGSFPGRFPPH